MNYNPYYFTPYTNTSPISRGLLGGLFHGRNLNFTNILNGTQKVLNVANQAIPVIKQISPVMKNAKTMFKVMNEFKKVETPTTIVEEPNVIETKVEDVVQTLNEKEPTDMGGPTFFI